VSWLYVVFKKADQHGWVIFVPFYNSWLLAEIGERPGWIGVLALASAFIVLPDEFSRLLAGKNLYNNILQSHCAEFFTLKGIFLSSAG